MSRGHHIVTLYYNSFFTKIALYNLQLHGWVLRSQISQQSAAWCLQVQLQVCGRCERISYYVTQQYLSQYLIFSSGGNEDSINMPHC